MDGIPRALLNALAVTSAVIGGVTVTITFAVRFLWRRGKELQEP